MSDRDLEASRPSEDTTAQRRVDFDPCVVGAIVRDAALATPGVDELATTFPQRVRQRFGACVPGVEIDVTESQGFMVHVHIAVPYGTVLSEVSSAVRAQIGERVAALTSRDVDTVVVHVDGISFPGT